MPLEFRVAGAADADAVAALHARSWQAAYRGLMSDAYLDGPVEAERRAVWTERLRHPRPDLWTLLVEDEGVLAGFVCAMIDHDPRWGTLVDNLHADPARVRQGLGRRMLAALAGHLADIGSGSPVHLFVLDGNARARTFYARMGGEAVEAMVKTEPDGTPLSVQRIAWRDAPALAAGTRA